MGTLGVTARPLIYSLQGAVGSYFISSLNMERGARNRFAGGLVNTVVREIVLDEKVIVLARSRNTFQLHRFGFALVDGGVVLDGVAQAEPFVTSTATAYLPTTFVALRFSAM